VEAIIFTQTAVDPGRPLTIRRVDAIGVSLPMKKPMVMAGERIEFGENLLVRIEAEGGLCGWGEATGGPTMTGDTMPGMIASVERYLAPALAREDALQRAALARRCERAIAHNSSAKSAVEIALIDLVGRHFGVPAAQLVGGAVRHEVEPMWLLGNADTDADIAEAEAKRAEGFNFFKLKVGIRPVAAEVECALAVRAQLGSDAKLCADANTGWDMKKAQSYVRGVEAADLLFLEQPLPSRQLRELAILNAQSGLPICGDECVATPDDVLALGAAGTVGGVNVKIIKTGGIAEALRATIFCEQLGLSATIAGKVAGSSLSAAATLVVGAAAPVLDWGVNLTHVYLAEDIVRDPIPIGRGVVRLPIGPGLGVEVDEAAVARFTV
jgi:muconate cycloisomerase